jgi:hypothetical protein
MRKREGREREEMRKRWGLRIENKPVRKFFFISDNKTR